MDLLLHSLAIKKDLLAFMRNKCIFYNADFDQLPSQLTAKVRLGLHVSNAIPASRVTWGFPAAMGSQRLGRV